MPKNKNKKSWLGRILRGILYLFLTLIVLVVIAYLFAGQIVKKVISVAVPPVTQTTASVDNVDLSLFQGRIEITGLKIGNPQGFSNQNIFELGRIAVSFDPKSVLTPTVVIRSVVIEGTGVSAEMNAKGQTNVGVLNQNIQNYLNAGQSKKTTSTETKVTKSETQTQQSEGGKKVIVRDLAITNSHLTLGLAGQTATVNLPNIHQQNIGADKKGQTVPEMIAQILSYFSSESIRAAADAARDLMSRGVAGAAQLLSTGAARVTQQVDQVKGTIGQDTKNIVDGIKGLF